MLEEKQEFHIYEKSNKEIQEQQFEQEIFQQKYSLNKNNEDQNQLFQQNYQQSQYEQNKENFIFEDKSQIIQQSSHSNHEIDNENIEIQKQNLSKKEIQFGNKNKEKSYQNQIKNKNQNKYKNEEKTEQIKKNEGNNLNFQINFVKSNVNNKINRNYQIDYKLVRQKRYEDFQQKDRELRKQKRIYDFFTNFKSQKQTRIIFLDTETTGGICNQIPNNNYQNQNNNNNLVNINENDRVIEIGAVEMINNQITGKQFQTYLNPEGRQMNYFAQKVHGISSDFLKKQPKFAEKYGELMDFLRDSMVIMHNAQFDMKFLNMEIKNIGKKQITQKQCMCSVYMASLLYQDEKLSLDSLCKKFGIDLKVREKHGALIDAMLLAQVYQADYDRFESVRLKLLQQNK